MNLHGEKNQDPTEKIIISPDPNYNNTTSQNFYTTHTI